MNYMKLSYTFYTKLFLEIIFSFNVVLYYCNLQKLAAEHDKMDGC